MTYDLILGPYFMGEEFHLVHRHMASLGIYKSESLSSSIHLFFLFLYYKAEILICSGIFFVCIEFLYSLSIYFCHVGLHL